MDSLTPYLLAALALAAGVIGWLWRDRTARAPAVERAAQATDELRRRKDDDAATQAAAAIEEQDQRRAAAQARQEVGTRASESVDETLGRLGAAPGNRVRQERGPGGGTSGGSGPG